MYHTSLSFSQNKINLISSVKSSTMFQYISCYRPQTKLREGNVFTPVCDSVHTGGCIPACNGCMCVCPGGCLLRVGHTNTPRQTPLVQIPPADTPLLNTHTPLGKHPPPPSRQTPPDTHTLGRHTHPRQTPPRQTPLGHTPLADTPRHTPQADTL